jgi:hypothetical protein
MYSVFAFALKVCKKYFYDTKHFFGKNIKTFRRHPDQIAPESSVRGGEDISPVRPGFVHPQIPSFSLVPEYSGDFLCEEKKERAQRGIEPMVLTSIYKGTLKKMAISHKS